MMTKLTDAQCVLLATAAHRDGLGVYPLPTSLKPGGGLHKALAALTTRGLIEDRETSDAATVSRADGDCRYGLFATSAGLIAMGIDCGAKGESKSDADEAALPEAPKSERVSKTDVVLDLLRREGRRNARRASRSNRLAATHDARGDDWTEKEGPSHRARQARLHHLLLYPRDIMSDAVERQLAALETMDGASLRDLWRRDVSPTVPRISPKGAVSLMRTRLHTMQFSL